ncbi:hypothetical protein [Bacillus cereus]|uniref:hypothetical protein n=1 Tax=Bacillus cereus TaxID=1396 RepID=UPI00019FDE26|nr:hypothetical protein [Bacillus cereus]EEK59010.1 hypothetical protein bcere0005_53920 [Bacillus cereus 172560W]WPA86241.1 hypothetical protein R6Y98_28275 [Bacillus cereus]
MVKKWGAILLILALMNGCSAKTDEKAKDEEPKSEQVEEVKTEITVKEQETNVKSSPQLSNADERLVNGLKLCSPLFLEVKRKAMESSSDNYQKVDFKKIEEAIAKSEEIYRCVETNMNDLSGTIKYKKTLDAFASSMQELIKFKNTMELFLQNKYAKDYMKGLSHSDKMLEKLDKMLTIYQEEQKQ